MCGRFTLQTPASTLASLFDLPEEPVQLAPRYNIAPTQPVAIIRQNAQSGQREWTHVHWGLIPSWSKDPAIGARMINARSETVAEKPSFRAAFKRRRCLIPLDGFYEWQRIEKRKQPYYITLKATVNSSNGGASSTVPFAVAGLWEYWEGGDGSGLESCTLLTTDANEMMKSIHHRMPVILEPEDYDMWLNSGDHESDVERSLLQHLLRPYPSEQMQMYPVSTYVNNARHEGATCIESIPDV